MSQDDRVRRHGSRLFLSSGLIIGVVVGLIGFWIPGGGMPWYFHAPLPLIALPLSVALIATGAVLSRLDRAETTQ